MADQFALKTSRSFANTAAYDNPVQVSQQRSTFSTSDAMLGAQVGSAAVSSLSNYMLSKTQAQMSRENNKHERKLADIEQSLMQSLSGQQLDDAERQYGESGVQVMIAQMVASSSAIVQGAGTGNSSGTARVLRSARASEANAKGALRADLRSERINIAQGRFNASQRYAQRTSSVQQRGPGAVSAFSNFALNTVRIGQAAVSNGE